MGALSTIALVEEHHVGGVVADDLATDVGRLAVTFIEMQFGLRPVSSLDDIASNAARRRIRRLVQLASQRPPGRRGRGRSAPVTVLHVRAQHPCAGALEASVTIECDGRIRALAIRLEQEIDRWMLVDIAPPEQGLLPAVTAASRLGRVPVDENGVRRSTFVAGRHGSGGEDRPPSATSAPGSVAVARD
jgi:hypothetical protein